MIWTMLLLNTVSKSLFISQIGSYFSQIVFHSGQIVSSGLQVNIHNIFIMILLKWINIASV